MIKEIETGISTVKRIIKILNVMIKKTGYELIKIERPIFERCPNCGLLILKTIIKQKHSYSTNRFRVYEQTKYTFCSKNCGYKFEKTMDSIFKEQPKIKVKKHS